MKIVFIFIPIFVFGCSHSPKPQTDKLKFENKIASLNSENEAIYIRQKLLSKTSEMRNCLNFNGRIKDPVIKLNFLIEGSLPKSITFIDSEMSETEETCMKFVVQKMRFPLSGDVEVRQSFRFYSKSQ